MSNIEIKQLFNFKRFPHTDLKLLCLLLYLPFGLALVVLRAFLALIVILIGCTLTDTPLVHRLVNKIACLSMGISVMVENPDKKENVEVYVSNNLSIFDHLAVHAATGSVSPGPQIHPTLSRGLGVHHFGMPTNNMEQFKKNITEFIAEQKVPVHFLPESKITNGKALLKFETYPFEVTARVQPLCISVERSFFGIALTQFGAGYWSDVFFYMFSPLTGYRLRFLPSVERKANQEEGGQAEFAETVRQSIAAALKIEPSEFSAFDLIEWEKRKLAEQERQQQQRISSSPSPSSTANVRSQQPTIVRYGTMAGGGGGGRVGEEEVRRMAVQVKDVLPQVPLQVVYKDLSKTRNVDTTITNIIEGRVYFIPEVPHPTTTSSASTTTPVPSSSSSTSSSSNLATSLLSQQPSTSGSNPTNNTSGGTTQNLDNKDDNVSLMFNTAASHFAKSAQERTKSFQERRDMLIANARRRYIEKHNLDLPF